MDAEYHYYLLARYRYSLFFRPSLANTIHPLELHSSNPLPAFQLLILPATHLLSYHLNKYTWSPTYWMNRLVKWVLLYTFLSKKRVWEHRPDQPHNDQTLTGRVIYFSFYLIAARLLLPPPPPWPESKESPSLQARSGWILFWKHWTLLGLWEGVVALRGSKRKQIRNWINQIRSIIKRWIS